MDHQLQIVDFLGSVSDRRLQMQQQAHYSRCRWGCAVRSLDTAYAAYLMPLIAAFFLSALLSLSAWAQTPDLVIGEVLGKPVHASQVQASRDPDRAEALRSLLIQPAIRQYLAGHRAEVALTPAESKKLGDAFKASMGCEGNVPLPALDPALVDMFVQMVGGNAKAQRFIYQQHGQGRVLFQQSGMEAFDATHRLVLALEKQGLFKFHNSADRTLALAYWTTDKHGAFLQPDPGADQAFRLDDLVDECVTAP